MIVPNGLLMIAPKSTVCEDPVHDHYTALARKALRLAKAGTLKS